MGDYQNFKCTEQICESIYLSIKTFKLEKPPGSSSLTFDQYPHAKCHIYLVFKYLMYLNPIGSEFWARTDHSDLFLWGAYSFW